VEDGWADVVISNGVFNLCPDKRAVFEEVHRVLRAGRPCSSSATSPTATRCPRRRSADIDLWTG
jgi:arsenite methyltransferase